MKALIKAKQVHPLLALSAVFFVLAAATFVAPLNKTASVRGVQTVSKKAIVKPTSTPTVTPVPTSTAVYKPTATATPKPNLPSTQNTTSQSNQNSNPQLTNIPPTATPQPTSQAAQNFQVNLKINGSPVGGVNVSNGQNQCDVLNDALSQGKIASLNMKYDNGLGTYGIYQINGIGKENSIWWVYKVNGNPPNQGCSYIKAASSDNVEWEYKGS